MMGNTGSVFFFFFFQSSNKQPHEEEAAEEDVLPEDEGGVWEYQRKAQKEKRGVS